MRILLTSAACFCATTFIATAQKWPTVFVPSEDMKTITKVASNNQSYRYQTQNYRIQSEVPLNSSLLSNFASSAESVAAVLQAIPLPLYAPPSDQKPLIQIAATVDSYESAGGAKGTAGFYSGRSQSILVQWEQLNRKGPAKQLLHRPAFDLLVHELCHLCMYRWMWKMTPWLTEGTAEYLAAAHLKEGRFDFRKIDHHIRDHIRNRIPSQQEQISVLKLETLLGMTSRGWLNRTAKLPPAEALQPYSSALLLTHYFFHGGAERRQEIAQYLEKLENVKFLKDEMPVLLTKSEANKIEKKLIKYWDSRGLKLVFK